MGQLGYFDANTVEPVSNDFSDPVPAGEYVMIVTESDVKPTRTGGEMLAVTLEIVEGEFAKRKVWTNFTLKNESEKAVQIGRGQLSALCRAVGIYQITDSAQLHNQPFRAKLKIGKPSKELDENGKPKYPAKNEVASFVPKNGSGESAPAAMGGVSFDDDDIPF